MVGDEEAHAQQDESSQSSSKIDPTPKWKAAITLNVDKEDLVTLADTGCMHTAVSANLLRRHSALYENKIEPHLGRTISIDGTKVETIGKMRIHFRIGGRHLSMTCRIVKNLVYDFILGWDFFHKYKCSIHPSEGYLQLENERIPLIPNSVAVSSSHFALSEDTVVPPLSKMITNANFYINPEDNINTTDTVEVCLWCHVFPL